MKQGKVVYVHSNISPRYVAVCVFSSFCPFIDRGRTCIACEPAAANAAFFLWNSDGFSTSTTQSSISTIYSNNKKGKITVGLAQRGKYAMDDG